MQKFNDTQILSLAKEMLLELGLVQEPELSNKNVIFSPIASDGSTRRFWRCVVKDSNLCIIAAPLDTGNSEIRESRAAWEIGKHLHEKGCPVPEVYGWDEQSGMLLFEDLGDQSLHGEVLALRSRPEKREEEITSVYRDIIRELAHMQVTGAQSFDADWCWDTPVYDREVMLKRESEYFLQAFWVDMLEKQVNKEVLGEFKLLADMASEAENHFFLHRDFQSRNIMIKDNRYRIIDYQGGRLGPLGYDLASLLIDPYCGLSHETQLDLEEYYYYEISNFVSLTKEEFLKEYNCLALQRNLQIIGAFAFLSRVRKKQFFKDFLQPALLSAQLRLGGPFFRELRSLQRMVDTALQELNG